MTGITIIGPYPPHKGGISKICSEQIASLYSKADIHLISFKHIYPNFLYPGGTVNSNAVIPDNKNIYVRRIISWYNPISWIRSAYQIKTNSVHIHWWAYQLFPIFFTILIIARLRKIKTILEIHNIASHEPNPLERLVTRIIFKLPSHLVVHAKQNKEALLTRFGTSLDRVSVIPMGIDFYKGNMTKKEAIQIVNRELKVNLTGNDKMLLCFGIIRDYKGIDDMLNALALIEDTNVKLIIAGKPWVKWDTYQMIIDEKELQERVCLYLDYVPDDLVTPLHIAADLVILPYKYFDAQSAAGLTALAYNKALVVTAGGGLPELVNDRKEYIANASDPQDLAKKIIRAVKMKKQNISNIPDAYSWDSITNALLELHTS